MVQRTVVKPLSAATLLSLPLLLACGSDSEAPAESTPCNAGTLAVTPSGITTSATCPGLALTLLPAVAVAGTWHHPDSCSVDGGSLRCPVAGGTLMTLVQDNDAVVRFEASQAVTVEGLSLEGQAQVSGARGWLSNGFQSWSQSGVVALAEPPSDDALRKALAARGDAEVDRYGNELSWWHTFVGGGGHHLVAGALTGARFRPWAQVHGSGTALSVRLVSGASGERIDAQPGDVVEGERWRIALGTDLDAMLVAYGNDVPSRRRGHPTPADVGWNSWYDLWNQVDEIAVRENAALAREVLTARMPSPVPLRIVIDDGWQKHWGEWEPNEKFPSGLDGLAADLQADGFDVGVWLAPLLVHQDSALVADHPTWFIEGAVYDHAMMGDMRVLDVTRPEAAEHLAGVIERIVSWGYRFLKIDFLFAGTFEGGRAREVTPMESYAEALRVIRDAAGPDVVLLAVGAPPIATFEYADAWRLGGDIALEPMDASYFFIPNQARSIASRWFLCGAVLCDADPPLLRKMTRDEVETGVWVASLAGGAFFLSDDLRQLPEERRDWGLDATRIGLGSGGIAAVPLDPFPEDLPKTLTNGVVDHLSKKGTHVVPSAWALPAGGKVLFNFTDEVTTVEGVALEPHQSAYVAK